MTMLVWFIFYVVSAFGLAYVVGHAVITKKARETAFNRGGTIGRFFIELVECPACFGFWTGIAMSMLAPFTVTQYAALNFLGWGFFTAGSNFILAKLTKLME